MSVQPVLQHLNILIQLHEQMLELAQQKRTVLIEDQVDELTRITNAERRLVKQIEDSEQALFAAARAFLQEKGVRAAARPAMTELIRYVFHAGERSELMAARAKLTRLLDQLKEINELNQQLIRQSLDFIRYSIDLMSGSPDDNLVYQRPEEKTAGNYPGRNYFDARA
jgi:hypothetical protein